jgi:hypothetical protein
VLNAMFLSKEGTFTHAPAGSFDHELFTLTWGSTVAALSFVFDKSSEEAIIQKSYVYIILLTDFRTDVFFVFHFISFCALIFFI